MGGQNVKMRLGNILDVLTGNATAQATTTAIQTASATPFNVILSVDSDTQTWLTQLAAVIIAVGIIGHQLYKK
jgi:hypothetical protein